MPKSRAGGAKAAYTILILPRSRSRLRKLHLSRNFLVSLAAIAGGLCVAGLLVPHLVYEVQTQETSLERLVAENRALRESHEEFEARVAEVSERLDRFEGTAGRIAQGLGLDESDVVAPAAGGDSIGGALGHRPIYDGELAALQARAAALEGSYGQLDEVFERRVSMLNATPNGMPVEGWFSHGYGWRTDPMAPTRRQFHRGLDIVADKGTPIRATADGLITRANRSPDLGRSVDISHGHGFVTRYAHMSETLVKQGERVRRGDVIGKVGSSGRSTGPHLHYEIFRDGRRVNPYKYLARGS